MNSAEPDRQVRVLILALVVGGVFVIALAIALAILVHPPTSPLPSSR